jgi:hypothetical protein
MDRDFLSKFTFIFEAIQSFLFIVALIIAFIFLTQFSHKLGVMEEKISVLEDLTPLNP